MSSSSSPVTPSAASRLGQPIVRTRQDLINSGDAFKRTAHSGGGSDGGGRGAGAADSEPATRLFEASTPHSTRRLNECCYSISNLILIIASIVGLVVLALFVQDDPLYEYGEHLLSLAFYRQLIYVMVALPLVLLIPVANAAQAFIVPTPGRLLDQQTGRAGSVAPLPPTKSKLAVLETVQRFKLFYTALMFLLVLLALVFVAPYVRPTSLAPMIELELRKHMRFRYENEFSYEFLDAIQEEYQCCDQLWYRANMNDYLPTSCFVPNTNLSVTYDQTCSWVLAHMVGLRCAVLAACLLLVLLALACLFALDLVDLLALSSRRRKYEFRSNGSLGSFEHTFGVGSRPGSFVRRAIDDDDDDHDHDHEREDCANGDRAHQRRRTTSNAGDLRPPEAEVEPAEVSRDELTGGAHVPLLASTVELEPAEESRNKSPILWARANYKLVERDNSQSPLFEGAPAANSKRLPIKSALKKTNSNSSLSREFASISSIDTKTADPEHDRDSQQAQRQADADADSLDDYAQRLRHSNSLVLGAAGRRPDAGGSPSLQREQTTRRSLLSVRFAE